MWWKEGRGPKVLKSKSPKVQGSKGPSVQRTHQGQKEQDISVTFKYELDSKEGPSCFGSKLLYIAQDLELDNILKINLNGRNNKTYQ